MEESVEVRCFIPAQTARTPESTLDFSCLERNAATSLSLAACKWVVILHIEKSNCAAAEQKKSSPETNKNLVPIRHHISKLLLPLSSLFQRFEYCYEVCSECFNSSALQTAAPPSPHSLEFVGLAPSRPQAPRLD